MQVLLPVGICNACALPTIMDVRGTTQPVPMLLHLAILTACSLRMHGDVHGLRRRVNTLPVAASCNA